MASYLQTTPCTAPPLPPPPPCPPHEGSLVPSGSHERGGGGGGFQHGVICEARGCLFGVLSAKKPGASGILSRLQNQKKTPKWCSAQCCDESFHPKTLPRHIKANSTSLPLWFQLHLGSSCILPQPCLSTLCDSPLRPLKPFIEPRRKACGLNPAAPPRASPVVCKTSPRGERGRCLTGATITSRVRLAVVTFAAGFLIVLTNGPS